MVGSVGMARGVSRPNSSVIQEALNLLSALGGDKAGATTKLLIEMKSVQDHNEDVAATAREVIIKANERETTVFEREKELERELIGTEELYRLRLLEITNGEAELQHKVDQAAITISEENGKIQEREDKLRNVREHYEETIHVDKMELTKRENVLKEDREDLKTFESSLQSCEEEIERDRVTLGSRAASLDQFKLELDARDARMRAAMENQAVVGGR